ncbi:hypothetical protein GcM3_070023 [Golovinomyces cichoracearum]|uniref:BHLH domain-containing protein n=1 Tax=Golovinomyces cichoracearum TaxID=62708 RepID=A0A420IT10_9PEZI|nr:hypothetical protein GcM3_070023 [Golovinomyces cichoracearum]
MDLSNPFIKNEPDDFFSSSSSPRPMEAYSHHTFGQLGNSPLGNINPDTLGSSFGTSYPNHYGASSNRNGGFGDDELLDSLVSNDIQSNNPMMNNLRDVSVTTDQFSYNNNIYDQNNASLSLESNNIYSNTPELDSMASPYVHSFNQAQYRMPTHNFGTSLQSPSSLTDSPILVPDIHSGNERNQASFRMQNAKLGIPERKNAKTMSPLTNKIPAISSLHIGSADNNTSFSTQPIQTASAHRHQKTLSGQWERTSSNINSFNGEFSPMRNGNLTSQKSDVLRGKSMPVKSNSHLQTAPVGLQSQEMKRRRRRESHNLVERRRRDNINERIQELSHLVPIHRLEDEKVRKSLQNSSALSPTLAGVFASPSGLSPPQATSGLAGPGAKRAAAGNITTGIPLEEKDKGPNKGDILNGAVSWTRDLMWMLHLKLQQQEELANYIVELSGNFPFQPSEDERRMQTELMDAMLKNDGDKFQYSRTPGSGLRVPKHTDLKGDPIGNSAQIDKIESSLSPGNLSNGDTFQTSEIGGTGQYWSGDSGTGSIGYKEENDYCMDLTQ